MRYKGVSGFALLNREFPVGRFLQQFPDQRRNCTAVLLGSYFGKRWRNVQTVIDAWDKPFMIEFHFGFREGPSFESVKRDIEQIQKLDWPGHAEILYSPVLEDAISDQEWKRYRKLIVRREPGAKKHLVRSVYRGGDKGGRYEERHGFGGNWKRRPSRTIWNMDGLSVDCKDGDTYFNQAGMDVTTKLYRTYANKKARIIWHASQQGLANTNQWYKPPVAERDYFVTNEQIRFSRALLEMA